MTAMIVIAVPLGIVLAALLAFAGVGIARRRRAESAYGEWNAARSVLAAIPDGLFLVRDGRICLASFKASETKSRAASVRFLR